MATKRSFGDVAEDGDRALPKTAPTKPKRTPGTVHGTRDETWEERTVRRTFYIDRDVLEQAKTRSKQNGESLSALISRGVTELLANE